MKRKRQPSLLNPSLGDSNHWKVVFHTIFPGSPPSTNTLYPTSRAGRRFMTKKGKDYKKDVQRKANGVWQGAQLIELPLRYHLKFFFPDKRKRDNANYEKCLIDALQGIIFVDDTQFKITEIEKHHDPNYPRTEVCIKMYEPTQEQVMQAAKLAKAKLKIEKEFESPCKRCPILFYWLTEDCQPNTDQMTHCSETMRRNLEFACAYRPRNKDDDVIIGEGLDKWL